MKKLGDMNHMRLSTSLNPRFDVVGPKKELENVEKQIEKNRKEAQKAFAREKQQLVKKLETLPTSSRFHGSESMQSGSRKVSRQPNMNLDDPAGRSQKTSTASSGGSSYDGRPLRISTLGNPEYLSQPGTSSRLSLFPDTLISNEGAPTVDKQTEALLQLKFVSDSALQMVTEADVAHKMVVSRQTSVAAAAAHKQSTPVDPMIREGYHSNEPLARSHKTSSPWVRPEGLAEVGGGGGGGGAHPSGLRSKKQSTVSNPDYSGMGHSGTGSPMEYHGPPSQAMQLMSMIRFISANQALDARIMRALNAVIEEGRNAIKAVRNGTEVDRAQDKLVKKLQELLGIVKPKGADLIISPEELLRCSYLRLSKDNVKELEDMIREKGMDPGIHRHTTVHNYIDELVFDQGPSTGGVAGEGGLTTMGLGEADLMKTLQPTSVFLTKAGAPLDRSRTRPPDSVSGPSGEDEVARLKRFKTHD